MKMNPVTSEPAPAQAARELVWLVGQPQLSGYLNFHKTKVVGGEKLDLRALTDEWRVANDIYHDLSKSEAGLAERIQCKALPARLKPLEAEVRTHRRFQRSFRELPVTFAMVELDKLIVSQTHVERGHYDGIAAALGDDLEARFRFCLPLEANRPPIRVQRIDDHRWLFSSPSTDLRERTPELLMGDALAALGDARPVTAMVGVPVGFGSNFMSAVRSGKRIVLQNGNHRAYALRRAGITHAPMIIEEVTRKDELRVAGDEEVNEDPEFYFAAPRPPLLKDFFDPRFAKLLSVRPIETTVEIEIKVRSGTATEWT